MSLFKSSVVGDLATRRKINNELALSSSGRIKAVMIAFGSLQLFQMIGYIISDREIYDNGILIGLKITAIVMLATFYILIRLMEKEGSKLRHSAVKIIAVQTIVFMIWAIISSLYAQSITSDISIYILMLFTIAAIVILSTRFLIALYGVSYLAFFFLIPLYQPNPEYVLSHRMNGIMMVLLASLISTTLRRYAISIHYDKQAIELKNKELLELSQKDGLTGLYNHRTVHHKLEEIINRQRTQKDGVYLVLLDLDNFKQINDRYGHKTGDEALIAVTDIIKTFFGDNGILGRVGGDEFMVVLKSSGHIDAVRKAQGLLDAVQKIELLEEPMSFSCGIVKWQGETADQLVDKADQLMYQSKRNGRNRLTI